MSDQAPSASLKAFIETRVDLEPVGQGPVIQIQLPSSGTFIRTSRPHRRVLSTTATCHNEETYARRCLASASSIYFSKSRRYPRSFLWRVLDNSKVLELRSVDLSKHDRESREARVILQLIFPSAIRKGCVALADDEHELLSVFIITKSNELYTLTIPTRFFCDEAASEEDPERWYHAFIAPTLRPCNPLRLVAGSPEQLVVTLDDGGILKLNRNPDQAPDKPMWKDVACHGGSGILSTSLRGLIRWQGSNSISYDGMVLDPSTAIAAEFSPSLTHLVTVCANHTLKIWNLAKGNVVFSMDLLGQEREPQDIPRVLLDAGNPDILRVFEADGAIEGDDYYVVTYSLHEGGQFKIWAIRDADHGNLGIRFLHSDDVLRPPDPESTLESKAVWKLADFKIRRGDRDAGSEFWVSMRSSRRYKVYSTKFDLTNFDAVWNNEWTSIIPGTLDQQPPPQILPSDARDASELWLEYLLLPGRHSRTLLETALSIYCATRKAIHATDAKAALEYRMSSAVLGQVHSQQVKPDEENGTAFAQYGDIMQQEWRLLYQEVQDLEKMGWQALTLVIDDQSSMPWFFFTGGCAAIRECSRLELVAQNQPAMLQRPTDLLEAPSIEDGPRPQMKLPHELAVLVQGAAGFRKSFSPSFKYMCHAWLSSALWQEPLYSVPKRIEDYYDRCGFAKEITEPAIAGLRESLATIQDIEGLTSDHFLAVIEEMPRIMETRSNLFFSEFGRRVLVKGAQEMINLHARISFDLLVLIVFIDIEVDRDILSPNLDTSGVFMALIEQLKRYELMKWLAKSVWSERSGSPKQVNDEAKSDSRKEAGLTILETLFAAAVPPQSLRGQSQSASLTSTIRDLLVYTTGGNDYVTLDEAVVHVQCNLLENDELDLASDFLSFQPSTPWAAYITGRYHLARGESNEAASCFQKAAYKMGTSLRPRGFNPLISVAKTASKSSTNYNLAASGFLSPIEVGHFGQGLPSYYRHIHQLFSSASYPSYSVEFAQLAVQFTAQSSELEPPTSLLTALFNASLQISDIETAFSALTRLRKHDQTALLPTLINTLLAIPNGPKQLLDLPWPAHIHPAIDGYLSNDKKSQLKRSEKPPVSLERQRKLLAAWRLKHGDFRGAAAALYSQMQSTVKQKGAQRPGAVSKLRLAGDDPEELGSRRMDERYLTVINLMACIGGDEANTDDKRGEAWVLSAADGGKRKVVTIEDVRKGWQKELDRRSVVEGGRWGFGLGNGDELDLG